MDVDEARATLRRRSTLDSLKSTRAIHAAVETPDEIERRSTRSPTRRARAVLRMVEHYVGAGRFPQRASTRISQAHAYGNATSEDFWKAMAQASGKPVDRILPTFVNQPGVPLVDVSLDLHAGRPRRARRSRSSASSLQPGARPGRLDVADSGCIKTAPAPTRSRVWSSTEPQRTLDVAPGCAPWVFANAGAQGYFRTAYAPEMLRALAPRVDER